MRNSFTSWLLAALAAFLVALPAAARPPGPLVDVAWLQKGLGTDAVLVIDTSPARAHAAGHIPGAIHVDLYGSGVHMMRPAQLEPLLQSWGLTPGRKVVIYDAGASNMATWLHYELYQHGFPEGDLFVLDGGLAKWKEAGGAVTKDPTPPPPKGTFRITRVRDEVRTRLPEFLVASGDRANNVLVEALEPGYHFGETKFFDKAGHIPHAVMWQNADFYNPDKTFKSPEEIRRMAAYLGIRPEQQVHSHCGGGVAATVPFFALKFIAGYPKVKVYKESQMEWMRDDRDLPLWTYAAPYMKREMAWLSGWGSRMMRMYGVSRVSVVDVRSPEAYRQGHVPYALNVPAEVFRKHLDEPARLAEVLGPAGVDATHEAVIVSSGGLNKDAALAFVALEKVGQAKVSLLLESIEDWGFGGFTIAKEPTIVGAPKTPQDLAVPPSTYAASVRAGVLVKDARATQGSYPKVFLASGKQAPAKAGDGKVVHVPYTELLNANGTPKPAAEIWKILAKAGVPRYAEIVCVGDEPGEAAVSYFVLKLMGFPDVKMLAA